MQQATTYRFLGPLTADAARRHESSYRNLPAKNHESTAYQPSILISLTDEALTIPRIVAGSRTHIHTPHQLVPMRIHSAQQRTRQHAGCTHLRAVRRPPWIPAELDLKAVVFFFFGLLDPERPCLLHQCVPGSEGMLLVSGAQDSEVEAGRFRASEQAV